MKLRFWGSRGSIARAGPETVRFGGNTSCVTLQSAAGTQIVLDCGTGGYGLARSLMANGGGKRGHLLFGHTHWDHIQGLPFFAPLFVPGNEWDIYGPRGIGRTTRDILAGQMQYDYFPMGLDDLGADLRYHDLVEGSFDIDDVKVTAQYLNHPALTLAYRLEVDGVTVVYSTDHEPRSALLALGKRVPAAGEDERHARFLEGADLVIHDAQYLAEEYEERRGWGHSTVEYVVDTAESAGVKNLALFHHDPSRTDEDIDAILELAHGRLRSNSQTAVFAAAEGQTIEMGTRQPAASLSAPRVHEVSALSRPNIVVSARSILTHIPHEKMDRLVVAALEAEGLQYAQVTDAREVVREIEQRDPAAVVLSWMGPETLDLARRIMQGKTMESPPAIVVVSEVEQEALMTQGPEAGIRDWLFMPFSSIYARTWLRSWLLRLSRR